MPSITLTLTGALISHGVNVLEYRDRNREEARGCRVSDGVEWGAW
jgi:hypothetical protein